MGWLDKYQTGGKIKNERLEAITPIDNTYVDVPKPITEFRLSPKDFTEQYINSDSYRQKLKKSGYNVDEEQKVRLNNIKDIKVIENTNNRLGFSTPGTNYNPVTDRLFVDKLADYKNIRTKSFNPEANVLAQAELDDIYYSKTDGNRLNDFDNRMLFDLNSAYKVTPPDTHPDEAFTKAEQDDTYKRIKSKDFKNVTRDYRPAENKADLNSMRYDLYKNGIYDSRKNQPFKKEHLQQFKKTGFDKYRLFKNYNDEDIIYLMNNLASNNKSSNSIMAKNGTVIKDDMGQWAHPGEITEIGSNSITMNGVGYPVLGVSKQTGEKKLMLPEKNYKFANTKQVTEYPLTNWLDQY